MLYYSEMRHIRRVLTGIVVAVVGLSAVVPMSASAAPGFNVITSPLPIKINTAPGQTVQTDLRIKNQGTQPEAIKVGLMKFAASGDNGQPNLYDLSKQDQFSSWVHFSPEVFTADPNIWYTVTMTIDVPPTASLGYYMAVTFSPADASTTTGAANLNGSVATLVLLNVVTPDENRALSLVSFETDHELYEYLPVNFKIKIHNSGNIYVSPAGNIFIQRGSKVVDTVDFNDAGGSVLPQSNRVYTASWTNGFPLYVEKLVNGKPVPDNHDIPKETLKWDFTQVSKFRFGEYSAKLLAVYDNGTQDVPLEATVSFWVVPWKMLLLLLAIILLVGFGLFSALRSTGKKVKSGLQKRRHDAKAK